MKPDPIEAYIQWMWEQYKFNKWQEQSIRSAVTFLETPEDERRKYFTFTMPKNHGRSEIKKQFLEYQREIGVEELRFSEMDMLRISLAQEYNMKKCHKQDKEAL